jgi:hypothetical protein
MATQSDRRASDATARRTTAEADEDAMPRRLELLLRALPESELSALISRMGIRVDPSKRIDVASQVARVLVGLPDVRDPSRLPPASAELAHRIAEAGGRLVVASVTSGLEPLIARGLVFGRRTAAGIELILPYAYLVQLRSWEGENPRALRALLAQAPFETVSAVASHYLGRPATPPVSLSLEAAWEQLSDRRRLAEEVEKLAPLELRLLQSVESVGGEVETDELLDLEREPMRLRGAGGVTTSRRGVGFALERRAFLIPIHPNRHVIPAEIAQIIGGERNAAREEKRRVIRSFVLSEDHAPRRARFASDPSSLAIALAFAAREQGAETRATVGTPRSLIMRLSQRFGRDIEASALVTALSRAVGLWDPSAASAAAPPGSLSLGELSRTLFATWRRGGAWDEARPDREVFRLAQESRDSSPIGALKEIVLDALRELGENTWVPWSSLSGYLAADERMSGLDRLLRRWGERTGVAAPDAAEVARRIILESLPALGVVDLGGEEADEEELTLRLTPRGRIFLTDAPLPEPTPCLFVDTNTMTVGSGARVGQILGLSSFVELGRVGPELEVLVSGAAMARALGAGLEADTMRARLEALATLPEKLARMFDQAGAVVGKGSLVHASGFLWIEDVEVREMLRTRRPASELFVDPSPPAGLLVAPDVDMERLVRRCRALGVEIELDGAGMKARVPSKPAMEAADPRTGVRRVRTPPPGHTKR